MVSLKKYTACNELVHLRHKKCLKYYIGYSAYIMKTISQNRFYISCEEWVGNRNE